MQQQPVPTYALSMPDGQPDRQQRVLEPLSTKTPMIPTAAQLHSANGWVPLLLLWLRFSQGLGRLSCVVARTNSLKHTCRPLAGLRTYPVTAFALALPSPSLGRSAHV